MKSNIKIWWAVSISIGILALLALILTTLFWYDAIQQNNTVVQEIFTRFGPGLIIVCLSLIAILSFFLARLFWTVHIPMNKLVEEVELIHSVNPAHRVNFTGGFGLSQLIERINTGAEQYEKLEKSVFSRVQIAKAELEEEKNILAAIMAEMPEAVLVCNKEGLIILYNSQARRFFDDTSPDATGDVGAKTRLGIGRSVFGIIGENIIQHALEEIRSRMQKKEENVTSNFVVTGKGSRLLKAEAAPILDPEGEFSGFIIIFNDITQGLRMESRAEFLLKSFQQQIRHSVASIKSAIEIVREYPDMKKSRKTQLMNIISTESAALEQLIHRESKEAFNQNRNQWPLMPISTMDLLETISIKAQDRLGIDLHIESCKGTCWVKVDTYTMILIFLLLLERIQEETGEKHFECLFSEEEDFVFFDIKWSGSQIKIEKLREWESMQLNFMKEGMPLHLKEVLEHHNADIWSYAQQGHETHSYLRIYLPAFRPQEQDSIRQAAVLPASRPEFYDFNLFNQPGQSEELDNRFLKDLTYTVFDTETTGLDPAGDDRIVSIGAVRIVNNHILSEEYFDQLVNPNRKIPPSATKIHGITDAMVQKRPTMAEILPAFFKYVENTVIVAHNAAFDMRMLQNYELETDIQFINPVLDTLLLSAIVHTAQEDQTLSSIAARLGIPVIERHTAMGDALMTANIFIKLIPLLKKKGIQTFGEAGEASEKTYYARMTF